MPLDPRKLNNLVTNADGSQTAQCPACQAAGHDKTGNHLHIFPDGHFGCVQFPGDSGHDHRQQNWAIAGDNPKRNGTPQRKTPTAKAPAAKEDKLPRLWANYESAIRGALFGLKQSTGNDYKPVKKWLYQNRDGTECAYVIRFEPPKGAEFKTFKPMRAEPGGWRLCDPDTAWPLYHLPEVLKSTGTIFVTEGEKACDAARTIGLDATTSSHGAKSPHLTDWSSLAGRQVVILPDCDPDGETYASKVASILTRLTPPATVKIVRLPGLPEKGDMFEFIEARDSLSADEIKAEVQTLATAAPLWTPPPEAAPVVSEARADSADIRGKIIEILTDEDLSAAEQRRQISEEVVSALAARGRFFFHADLRDFDSAMFFDNERKRLERVRCHAFSAWVSEWLRVNRADALFKYIAAAVETAALSSPHTTGILPEAFWAARPGAVYLSNGDGQLVKVTAQGVALSDNGIDGVLFAAGRTLAPWRLCEPQDPFTLALFANVNCLATHGQDLWRLWLYSLPTSPRSKPPLCVSGEVGSGKTRTAKGMAELYGLPFIASKVEETGEDDFWPGLDAGGLFTLDNADTRCKWLPDAIAAASTDGCNQRRKLYTNAENVILRPRAWLCITSANPSFASDAGLADRLLVVRLGRREGATSDAALSDEIAAARDAGLSHIAATLSTALADTVPTPDGLNARHPDFAAFAVKIGRALGREAEAVAALRAAEKDKAVFCLENDPIAAALLIYLRDVRTFDGTAAELAPKLIAVDGELADRLSARRLTRRLSALWPHLQGVLKTARREEDRKGFAIFTLKTADSADNADFELPFH